MNEFPAWKPKLAETDWVDWDYLGGQGDLLDDQIHSSGFFEYSLVIGLRRNRFCR